jgi:cytochrome c oxidase subunit IV
MTTHAQALESGHAAGTTRLFFWVWFWLVLLTGVEVYLAYLRLPVHFVIIFFAGLSVIKAALIVAYFMHMRFERLGLFLMIIPAIVLIICLIMIFFFPDGFRLLQMRPH